MTREIVRFEREGMPLLFLLLNRSVTFEEFN
jgi:hypothetical protein